jgi:aspartate aminotransferase
MSKILSKRVKEIKESATLTIAAKASQLKNEGIDIIGLNVGEPDYDTPLNIKAAAIDSIHEGHTKYTPVSGIPELKSVIIRKFQQDNNLEYKPNEIMVSCGAKQAIINMMLATLDPEDEVIIPAPYWTSYPDMCLLAEAKPVIVETTHADNFKITPEKLKDAITNKTKMIIINSPSNPTGVIYSKEELEKLAEIITSHPNILVLSDDIYEKIIWPNSEFYNILTVAPHLNDRTILINGVSKTYAMTGWRIGYAAGPADIIKAMTKIQSQSTSSPCSISQDAAVEALNTSEVTISEMINTYHSRYSYITEILSEIPEIEMIESQGSFYIFPNVTKLISKLGLSSDLELTEFLLEKANVSVIPGTVFGAPGYIRISFAICKKRLREAVDRIKSAIAESDSE